MATKQQDELNFTTIIKQTGKTTTGIEVPAEIMDGLGGGKKPPVCVTLNGYTYRSTVAVMGGAYMISLSAEHRTGAGVAGGDTVVITLRPDTAPRVLEVPEELQQALDANKAAKEKFESLSYSNKQRYTLPVKDAKTEETRRKRIEKAIAELSA
jgi:hypothetical protein